MPYSGGEHARQVATTFTGNKGGTTINLPVIVQIADAATKDSGADFTSGWSQVSATFCNQASGVVNAFVSNITYCGEDSIFWNAKMPTLLNNPRVTEIFRMKLEVYMKRYEDILKDYPQWGRIYSKVIE